MVDTILGSFLYANKRAFTGRLQLARCLAATNVIESPNSVVRRVSGRVTRYRDVQMALRWVAAGFLEAEKAFRRLRGRELITSVTFPSVKRAGYIKFKNPASRFALVGVFVAETAAGVRVAVTGAASCVFRVAAIEKALSAKFEADAVPADTVKATSLNGDMHGSAEYRAHLITVMTKRAVTQALGK